MKKRISALAIVLATATITQVQAKDCSYQKNMIHYWASVASNLMSEGYSYQSAPVKYADSRGVYWASEHLKCLGVPVK